MLIDIELKTKPRYGTMENLTHSIMSHGLVRGTGKRSFHYWLGCLKASRKDLALFIRCELVHTYMCMCGCVHCVCICACVCACVDVCVHMHICACVGMFTVYVCVHVCVCLCVCVCVCVCVQ